MKLHPIDVAIIVIYVATSVLLGYWVSRRASRDTKAYFLGGNTLPWYFLGVSNASGMFDIAGTMWLVYLMFIYGLKSVWVDRKSTRLNSSHLGISYAVFCLKKKI